MYPAEHPVDKSKRKVESGAKPRPNAKCDATSQLMSILCRHPHPFQQQSMLLHLPSIQKMGQILSIHVAPRSLMSPNLLKKIDQ
jgi:hypothetical protein